MSVSVCLLMPKRYQCVYVCLLGRVCLSICLYSSVITVLLVPLIQEDFVGDFTCISSVCLLKNQRNPNYWSSSSTLWGDAVCACCLLGRMCICLSVKLLFIFPVFNDWSTSCTLWGKITSVAPFLVRLSFVYLFCPFVCRCPRTGPTRTIHGPCTPRKETNSWVTTMFFVTCL